MKKRRKMKPRSLDEPWTVSMWEAPEYVKEPVFIEKKTDQDGKQISKYQNMDVINGAKNRSRNRKGT